ncbi:MAG: hypothetical protein WA817_16935 [Candidatus Acidiferrum sp.]
MNVNAIRHPVVEHDVRASGRQPLGDRAAIAPPEPVTTATWPASEPIWATAALPAVLAMNI